MIKFILGGSIGGIVYLCGQMIWVSQEMADRKLELDLMMDHYLELEERMIRLEEIASE